MYNSLACGLFGVEVLLFCFVFLSRRALLRHTSLSASFRGNKAEEAPCPLKEKQSSG